MATPNMAFIASSLERSFQNCSLNHQNSSSSSSSTSGAAAAGDVDGEGDAADSVPDVSSTTLELNSETPMPYHWEQCLDLKTGEIYYINWRTGMKMTEDPRLAAYGGYYSEGEENSSSSDSSESSSESSPCSSREQWIMSNPPGDNNSGGDEEDEIDEDDLRNMNVLVVAGCKGCLMYYMVPKNQQVCPKCYSHLLHFDGTTASPES